MTSRSGRTVDEAMTDPSSPATQEPHVYRVGELVVGLRRLLEDRVGRVWVSGEISNLHEARSGHRYFTLKDDEGQLRAAFFRGAARNLRFDLEEGMEVRVYAEVSLYEARGDLQLIVREVEPVGQGVLQRAFEQLKARLGAEGLFDEARKRPLPAIPRGVGIVTSETGAAVRDVVRVASDRFPGIPLRIVPTRVQGDGSEDEIAAALGDVADVPGIDVVLLVRGGGSLEDLWAFNTEVVVRALVNCPLPVVSGVGHEVDFTLADAAADARAATPSAAAALALPERETLVETFEHQVERLLAVMRAELERARASLDRQAEGLRQWAPAAQVQAQRERWRAAVRALRGEIAVQQRRHRARLAEAAARLDSLSPLSVLDRGYALVRRGDDGTLVRRASQVSPGDALSIRVADARITATAVRSDEVE